MPEPGWLASASTRGENMARDILKRKAAECALSYVQDGMTLGLGSGSTSAQFIEMLGQRIRSGNLRDIYAVPTSVKCARLARRAHIPLTSLDEHHVLDLAVDGADEVDPDLNLIKGLGRALLREKIVEIHAAKLVIVVDETKLVSRLGTKGPLPVEIVPFEYGAHVRWLESLGCQVKLMLDRDDQPAVTDNGNYLACCYFAGGLEDPFALARVLADRPGIVEHGLFLNMAHQVIVSGAQGIKILESRASSA